VECHFAEEAQTRGWQSEQVSRRGIELRGGGDEDNSRWLPGSAAMRSSATLTLHQEDSGFQSISSNRTAASRIVGRDV